MAYRLPVKSGRDVIKTFFNAKDKFNIKFKRQGKGSHVVLSNKNGKCFSVIDKKQIKPGTLLGIIEDACMTKKDFLEFDP